MILVTGGLGYIGSHIVVELVQNGYDVVIFDDVSNSYIDVYDRLKELCGDNIHLYIGDTTISDTITNVFKDYPYIKSVIHLAGYKSIPESIIKPQIYYETNLVSLLNLTKVMSDFKVFNLVFSSSAVVYGTPKSVPITEDFDISSSNPYGRTKIMSEEILHDLYKSDELWNISILRYFNPLGSHKSGMIGEKPKKEFNNLMNYIVDVASGKVSHVDVYGDDYDTPDGTGVRDYIHVIDLAKGHVNSLDSMKGKTEYNIYNLGAGKGYSVLELIEMFSHVSGIDIPYKISQRRLGDVAECYADVSKANLSLNWVCENGLKEMCEDVWRWYKFNDLK